MFSPIGQEYSFLELSELGLLSQHWLRKLLKMSFNIALSAQLHGPSMLPDKVKFVVCSIISLALPFRMKHLVIDQLQKRAKFSAFHWSTSRSQAFIGQLLGTSRVVHLPKRTVMVLFTISDV